MRNIICQIKKLFSTYCKHPATALKKKKQTPSQPQDREGERFHCYGIDSWALMKEKVLLLFMLQVVQ